MCSFQSQKNTQHNLTFTQNLINCGIKLPTVSLGPNNFNEIDKAYAESIDQHIPNYFIYAHCLPRVFVTTCRKNLLTTFARKIEFQFSNFLVNFEKPIPSPVFGKTTTVSSQYVFDKYKFSLNFHKILTTKWLEVEGTSFRRNMIIQKGIEADDSPTFALILEILYVNDGDIYFCCQDVDTLGFHKHFHAYAVVENNDFSLIKFDNTSHCKTYFIQKTTFGTFICM